MDTLDQEIKNRRVQIVEFERKINIARKQLVALLEAQRILALSGANGTTVIAKKSEVVDHSNHRPNPVGSMSEQWVKTLNALATQPSNKFSHEEIFKVAQNHGYVGKFKGVRDRIFNYKKIGLMAGDRRKGFFLTPKGLERLFKEEEALGLNEKN